MTPLKLNVFFAFFPYGGNGSISNEHPSIRNWFAETVAKMKQDPRVGEIGTKDFCDTPITMTRNDAVIEARAAKADVLIMCDSDNHPDRELEKGDPQAKPWWDSSFTFLHERKGKGLCSVVAAPYCGPPPIENVYVFRWACGQSDHPQPDHKLAAFTREEAGGRGGIEEAGALPTGLIMFDMEIFEITDPKHEYKRLCEQYPPDVAKTLTKPWFYYEWDSIYASSKASTEDVTTTRDMALALCEKLGYNPLFVNWDAWAGHWKPKCVEKPRLIFASDVSRKLMEAARSGRRVGEQLIEVRTERPPAKPYVPLAPAGVQITTQPASGSNGSANYPLID